MDSQLKSPAFQFYPSDWLSSQRVQLLSLEEEGMYIRLLCYCWNHGRIPADPEKIVRIVGKGASTTLAQMVATMFQADPSNPGWLIHERLEQERCKQMAWRAKSAEGGRKSAEKRAKLKGGSTTVPRVVEQCLPNGGNQKSTLQSSSSSSNSTEGDEQFSEVETTAKKAGISPTKLSTPPKRSQTGTQGEVRAFCVENQIPISDADWFFFKCEGNGWTNGGKPIKDWRATLRSWKAGNYLPSQKTPVNGKPAPRPVVSGSGNF